ncbi:uncharacterized protein EAF01_003163 [Botrytis porri]|uniref:uncharacterized protein n=1 Tax=Botrytis porri TaxID=87229 RepID=UPI0018FFF0F2|nr:uncharacterized protein EAF01_003163 [Botrytis porri]KAF7909445.1 hypothetical protein EAF01_003163 [Botrytis porri]
MKKVIRTGGSTTKLTSPQSQVERKDIDALIKTHLGGGRCDSMILRGSYSSRQSKTTSNTTNDSQSLYLITSLFVATNGSRDSEM